MRLSSCAVNAAQELNTWETPSEMIGPSDSVDNYYVAAPRERTEPHSRAKYREEHKSIELCSSDFLGTPYISYTLA